MSNLVQTWICGPDRVWHAIGGRTQGTPPPPSRLRMLFGSSSQYGSVPPPDPDPETYNPDVWPDGFILEVNEPSTATTGVPSGTTLDTIIPSAYGSLNTAGNILTITANNVTIDRKFIPYYLVIRGNNVTITRCEIVGGPTWTGAESALIDHRWMTQTGLKVVDCTLHCEKPNLYMNAFIGHHATIRRCHIYHVVDGLGIYNNNSAISPVTGETYKNDGDITMEGCLLERFAFFTPDPTHSDNITHNDGIQFHGGKRSKILGNNFNWFAAPASEFAYLGTSHPAYTGANLFVGSAGAGVDATATANRGYGQGIIIQSIVSTPTGNTVRGNWFHGAGGQCTIRCNGNYVGQNRFDLTGKKYTTSGSRYEIRTNIGYLSGIEGLYTNVWNDTGAFLTYNPANPANGTGGIRADA